MSHKRSREDKRRLEKLYQKTRTHYGRGVWYDERKERFIKYDGGAYAKHVRRYSNRKVRRTKNISNYGKYRKTYDYWWELY